MKYIFSNGNKKMSITDYGVHINTPSFWYDYEEIESLRLEENIVIFFSEDKKEVEFEIKPEEMEVFLEAFAFIKKFIRVDSDPNKMEYSLIYYGGHPLLPNEDKAIFEIKKDEWLLTLRSGNNFSILVEDVTNVSIKSEKEVEEYISAVKLALFGIFALAMKKNKRVNKSNYIVIETKEYPIILSENNKVLKKIYASFVEHKENSFKEEVQTNQLATSDPYAEIKKLKELLDLEAITQDEFDAKKKQLLGL